MKPIWRILIYTLIAGVFSALTAPIPGTSLLLTALEIYMIVHLAKVHDYTLGLKEIGYSAVAIYGLSTLLKDTALELMNFFPVIGWIAEPIVAMLFVLFLGLLANLYFGKPSRQGRDLQKHTD
ncbi:MAG: hypothetical protein QY328_02510 [Anaerolineales bacterium]|jgi:uncharacterized protein (DUF697 family)|nr:hypothetical protein [Anaerolineales bacterium]WKZ40909.1 MAG: hypothetical protein QY328_02510 [Anaerolineales bacterium]